MARVEKTSRVIVCVLANNARKAGSRYTNIGTNTKKRIDYAWEQVKKIHDCQVTWIFGAGTHIKYQQGPTLASLQAQYLQTKEPQVDVVSNQFELAYWGTLEEIDWVIKKARALYPNEDLTFLFSTQIGHLTRVEHAVRLFYPELERTVFIGASHDGETLTPWSLSEIRSYIKLVFIKCGLARRRWQIGYPK